MNKFTASTIVKRRHRKLVHCNYNLYQFWATFEIQNAENIHTIAKKQHKNLSLQAENTQLTLYEAQIRQKSRINTNRRPLAGDFKSSRLPKPS